MADEQLLENTLCHFDDVSSCRHGPWPFLRGPRTSRFEHNRFPDGEEIGHYETVNTLVGVAAFVDLTALIVTIGDCLFSHKEGS